MELELHSAALAGLCRICGGRSSNHRVTYECTEHTKGLMGTFLVDVSQDKPDIHPAHFCNNCYRACRHEKPESEGKDYNCSIQVQQWDEHATDTCNKFSNSKKGGRPKKATKNCGRPKHTEAEDNVTRAKIKYLWWSREPLRVAHLASHTAYPTPRVAHRASHTVSFTPRTACFTPRVAHSTFYTARRTQYVLHRASHTVRFTPRVAHSAFYTAHSEFTPRVARRAHHRS